MEPKLKLVLAYHPVQLFHSRRVTDKDDLDEALIEMIDSKGPYLLDVMVPHQEHVLPMIPSGMTVRDIIKA